MKTLYFAAILGLLMTGIPTTSFAGAEAAKKDDKLMEKIKPAEKLVDVKKDDKKMKEIKPVDVKK